MAMNGLKKIGSLTWNAVLALLVFQVSTLLFFFEMRTSEKRTGILSFSKVAHSRMCKEGKTERKAFQTSIVHRQ